MFWLFLSPGDSRFSWSNVAPHFLRETEHSKPANDCRTAWGHPAPQTTAVKSLAHRSLPLAKAGAKAKAKVKAATRATPQPRSPGSVPWRIFEMPSVCFDGNSAHLARNRRGNSDIPTEMAVQYVSRIRLFNSTNDRQENELLHGSTTPSSTYQNTTNELHVNWEQVGHTCDRRVFGPLLDPP